MRLVVVSSALPRRCGLAAFTDDLRRALRLVTGWRVSVCAIDRDGLAYGPEVAYQIRQDDPHDYRRAARDVAAAGTDLVVIQHEYGIFGGPDGSHVLELADELRLRGVPYAVTLHTTLAQPSDGQRATLAALCANASLVTVFAREGRRLAVSTAVAPKDRVVVVPHGAPSVLRQPISADLLRSHVRQALRRLDGSPVVTTFGLVGPGKGLEYGIHAIALAAQRGVRARYLIAGATHPEVARHDGEAYRNGLHRLARRLGVADRVSFVDAFLTEEELSAILARTEVFLTPYRSPEQICSGALTFALAAGRPVVSTAYRYAVEMLAPGAHGTAPGVVVPCGDAAAIADAITGLLADPVALSAARDTAHRLGATLTWPAVASRFAQVFTDAAARAAARGFRPVDARPVGAVPPLQLAHLNRMVDEVGIIQFADGTHPVPESGYCVDDMARLGIVAAGLLHETIDDGRPLRWLHAATGFLRAATENAAPAVTAAKLTAARGDGGGAHNVMDRHGRWQDLPHLGDHVGRAIWAAATIMAAPRIPHTVRIQAADVLHRTAPLLHGVHSPRTLAYGLLGLTAIPATGRHSDLERVLRSSATRLASAGAPAGSEAGEANPGWPSGWPWFEPILAYDNARLPHALLAAGMRLLDAGMISRALSTLDWYLAQVGLAGPNPVLRLVGNGWRTPTGDRLGPSAAEGDEQPIDAAAVVEALAFAWQHTKTARYADLAQRAFAWFHGVNRAGAALYDPADGGCADGLSATGPSRNWGAESTLAYLQALLALRRTGLATDDTPAGGTAAADSALVGSAPVDVVSGQAASRLSRWSSTSGREAQAMPMAESAAP